jgi:hypothetical protein
LIDEIEWLIKGNVSEFLIPSMVRKSRAAIEKALYRAGRNDLSKLFSVARNASKE